MNIVSPLFPALLLSLEAGSTLTLPPKPHASSGSVALYIMLAESTLYVHGFEPHEQAVRPPAVLRGALVLRITKPVRIRQIELTLKGTIQTDWPEGIPPRKTEYSEASTLLTHTWPFYSGEGSHGANTFRGSNPDVDEFSLDGAALPARSRISRGFSAGLFPSRGSSPGPEQNPSTFQPGEYVYNFEHPLPASTPESISGSYGRVRYHLEAIVERSGLLATSLHARLPLLVVRAPLEDFMGESEPIHIARDWEDQLAYDIVVGAKTITLDSFLPIAFKFSPLDKNVQLLRIRVYITENMEYYCRNNKVHRLEPTRKHLLSEFRTPNNLLAEGNEVGERELEFQVYVPERLGERSRLHPNTSFKQIQVHHWLKICLRLARKDPLDALKPKHYEISIDSPINLLAPQCAHVNTFLPAYLLPEGLVQPHSFPVDLPLSPHVTAVDDPTLQDRLQIHLLSTEPVDLHLQSNLYQPKEIPLELQGLQAHDSRATSPLVRPIHLIRKPSFNPPTFEESESRSGRASPIQLSHSASLHFSPLPTGTIDHLLGEPLPPTYDSALRDGVHKLLTEAMGHTMPVLSLSLALMALGALQIHAPGPHMPRSRPVFLLRSPTPPVSDPARASSPSLHSSSTNDSGSTHRSEATARAGLHANDHRGPHARGEIVRPSVELRSVLSMTSLDAYERQVSQNQHSPLLASFGTNLMALDSMIDPLVVPEPDSDGLDLLESQVNALGRLSPINQGSAHSSRRPSVVSYFSDASDLLSQPLLQQQVSLDPPRPSIGGGERNQSMDITAMLGASLGTVWNPLQGASFYCPMAEREPQQPLSWKARQTSFGAQTPPPSHHSEMPVFSTMAKTTNPGEIEPAREDDPLSTVLNEPKPVTLLATSSSQLEGYSMT